MLQTSERPLFIGTYTNTGESEGIYTYRFDSGECTLHREGVAGEISNPSFLAIHPVHNVLYAVSETGGTENGERQGVVISYKFDPSNLAVLEKINTSSTNGPGPCHLIVDATGSCLIVANYSGGSVALLPILPDGELGEIAYFLQHKGFSGHVKDRQMEPHAHSVTIDPSNRFVYVADLGLDQIRVYNLDIDNMRLAPNEHRFIETAPGAGPRHLDFHPNGRYVYAINELNSTIAAYEFSSETGKLTEIQTVSTLPPLWGGLNHTADIHVHPNGAYLYGSNRGHNSIAIFEIDETTGKITGVGHEPTLGETPRNFAIDPTGKFLLAANQDSNSIATFAIEESTGLLRQAGPIANVPRPVCLRFYNRGD